MGPMGGVAVSPGTRLPRGRCSRPRGGAGAAAGAEGRARACGEGSARCLISVLGGTAAPVTTDVVCGWVLSERGTGWEHPRGCSRCQALVSDVVKSAHFLRGLLLVSPPVGASALFPTTARGRRWSVLFTVVLRISTWQALTTVRKEYVGKQEGV